MNRMMFVMLAAGLLSTQGQTPEPQKPAPLAPELKQQAVVLADKAVAFLKTKQNADGSLADGDFGLPITALCMHGILSSKRLPATDPFVEKSLKFIASHVREDGGIYPKSGAQRNYSTAASILALSSANQPQKYTMMVKAAAEFLKKEQWDETEKQTTKDVRFGGAGYGGTQKTRPDLANTAMMLEALKASGLSESDPAYQNALVFITRCQNYSGEGGNDQPNAKLVNDGGFYYTPAEDYNPAGGDRNKGLRSYGSMTYTGLKTMIVTGVKKEDPRIKAAVSWIKKHYTLKENPGLGQEGLYYYYHTFAKAMTALEIDQLTDAEGKKHDWRKDLVETLAKSQKPDGSWSNENKRWLEQDPKLVTAYVLISLGYVLN